MHRGLKRFAVGLFALVTLATVGIAFVSFARKVDSFSTAGLISRVEGGELEVLAVDPEGAAAKAGLVVGDRLVLVDGQTAASVAHPEKFLARKPFPHRLVVISRGEVRGLSLGEPSVRFDAKYLFLSFVGFLYLIIGLFTAARERTRIAGLFWALCLSSFAVYVITPAGPRDELWKASWLAEDLFRALLPALFLHFFLLFPRPIRRRRLLPLLYVPAAAYVAAQLALLPAEPTPRLAVWLEGVERFWFGYFAAYVAAVVVRLLHLLRHRHEDAEADKQLRWIGLGRDRRADAVPASLGAAARLRPRVSPALERRRRAPGLHPAGLRVRDPEVAALGRGDLRPRGRRDDRGGRAGRRHLRAAELAARPHARGHGRGRQERHRVRFGADPGLPPGSGQEAPHRRARADPVPRHLPRAPRAARHRARLRHAPAPRGGRSGDRAAGRRGAARRALLAVSLRGPRTRPGRRRAGGVAHRGGPPRAARRHLRRSAAGGAPAPPLPGIPDLLRHALRRRARRRAGRRAQGRTRAPLLRGRVAADGGHRPGQPRLRERPPLWRAGRAAGGDPHAPGVPGERHPLLLVGNRRGRRRGAHPHRQSGVRGADRGFRGVARRPSAGSGPAGSLAGRAAGRRRRVAVRDAAAGAPGRL